MFHVHPAARQKGGMGLRLNQLQAQSTGQELNYKLTPQPTCQGSLTDYHHSCRFSFEENNKLFVTTLLQYEWEGFCVEIQARLRPPSWIGENHLKYTICFFFLSNLKLGVIR